MLPSGGEYGCQQGSGGRNYLGGAWEGPFGDRQLRSLVSSGPSHIGTGQKIWNPSVISISVLFPLQPFILFTSLQRKLCGMP